MTEERNLRDLMLRLRGRLEANGKFWAEVSRGIDLHLVLLDKLGVEVPPTFEKIVRESRAFVKKNGRLPDDELEADELWYKSLFHGLPMPI